MSQVVQALAVDTSEKAPLVRDGRWIKDFDPENEAQWEREGKRVARRNLIGSILAEHVGFSVWMLWSVTAPRLPQVGFHYTTDQLFYLVALPGLIGAFVRFPYTFAVPKFGGRNWTMVSALALLLPSLSLAFLVRRPETPFWMMALFAATAGLGGGNFASSMTNISFFYPDRSKGWALGLNAAGGNIGVSSVQLLVPLAIVVGAEGGVPRLENAGLMWLPLIALATVLAFSSMDNLASARSPLRDQLGALLHRHTWIVSFLYIGTFGSFVGYSAAFPLLLKTLFPHVTANLAFIGPLLGSVVRPLGGKLADRVGGGRVTAACFIVMASATSLLVYFVATASLVGFLAMFFVLFVTTGLGNGSTYRMLPAIFRSQALVGVDRNDQAKEATALTGARRDAAAAIGISSAIGALGGYFIPRAFGASIKATGGPRNALLAFLVFYGLCACATWWFYLRTRFLTKRVPSLAAANA